MGCNCYILQLRPESNGLQLGDGRLPQKFKVSVCCFLGKPHKVKPHILFIEVSFFLRGLSLQLHFLVSRQIKIGRVVLGAHTTALLCRVTNLWSCMMPRIGSTLWTTGVIVEDYFVIDPLDPRSMGLYRKGTESNAPVTSVCPFKAVGPFR